jgi:tetratricopeptide (TPR) repeat protein
MRYRYPQPGNEDEFEDFCVRFYRHYLKRDTLVRYGKRGEVQDGIDIIDQLCVKPFVAIQCRNHEPTKTISPGEITAVVSQVESSSQPVDHFIIATTAKKSTKAQDTIREHNQRSDESRRFTVEIHFWEDIYTFLNEFGRAVADFIVSGQRNPEEATAPAPFSTHNYASELANSARDGDDTELYPEINGLLISRKLEAAEHEISKLPDPEQDPTLGTTQRYAILRLRAKLAVEQLQFDEAARLFTLAYETCPALQQSRQNRVLALELSGKREQAFTEAARLLNDGLRSPFLVSLLVRNASAAAALAPHQEIIDEYISHEEVNLAIAHSHLAWNDLELAEAAAHRALDAVPESAHALFACGMVEHHLTIKGRWQDRSKHLDAAIQYYSKALACAERGKYKGLIPEVRSNRGRAYRLSGNLNQAAQDFRGAVHASDTPSLYAEGAVGFFLHVEDYASAWELLPVLDTTSDEAAFLSAVTQYYHARADRKNEYTLALQALADQEIGHETEARFLCVQWSVEAKDFGLARECVPKSFVKRYPFQGNVLLAWIDLEEGQKEHAREFTERAWDSSALAANRQEISVLGRLLASVGLEDKALPLFEQAATPGLMDEDCKRLIGCAQRVERHDTLLRVCAELRETNQQDNTIRRLEVELLSNYAPDRAYALAKEFIQYDATYFSAARNYLAVGLGKPEEVQFDENNLPSPDDFEPAEAYLIVTPYLELGRYRDALEYTYQQLRTHFSEERAHGQYIALVLQYGEKADVPYSLDVVDKESAARLENLVTGGQRGVVIEDRQPDPARNEFSPSTAVARALIGRRTGDTVDLRGSSLQPQEERVVEIQSKYVRLFQDALSNFQNRFPDAHAIQSMHLGSGGAFDPAPLIKAVRERGEYVEKATTVYHANLCSLHFLASRLGTNERQVMTALTATDKWFVRCVHCSPQQFSEAAKAGLGTKKVVLDTSAIITIAELDAWEHLDGQFEFLVSRNTVDLIVEWLHDLERSGGEPTTFAFATEDGRMSFQEVTAEQLRNEQDGVRDIVTRVGSLATVKSSLALAALDPKRREEYIQLFGRGTLEALCLARDEASLLWTDDLVVSLVAEADFGVKRIWTQLAFKVLEGAERVSSEAYSGITAKLAAWNYITTVWNPQDVISAGNLCDWDSNQWPLKQCLRLIGMCPLPLPAKARLAGEFFRLLRQSPCRELKQTSVVQAVLNALGHRNAVEWLLRNLGQFFPIDVASAQFLEPELVYWLRIR